MTNSNKNAPGHLRAVLLAALIVPAPLLAQNLTIPSTNATLFFDDSDDPGVEWAISGLAEYFQILNIENSQSLLHFDDLADMRLAMDATSFQILDQSENSIVYVHRDAPASLSVESDGDVAVNSRLGIGTVTPNDDLEIQSGSPGIYFDNNGPAPNADWRLSTVVDDLRFTVLENGTGGPSGVYVMTLDAETGYTGIGASEPKSQLHVANTSGTNILVENTDAGATGDQVMFKLSNASSSKVRFAIASAGNNTWTFDNNPNTSKFSISKVGTGVNEFALKANGDATFRGRSFATNHVNTSSRAAKTDFSTIDVNHLLARVASLPLSQWRYKEEQAGEWHVGPVAEDFQRAFGLGDGKTISTVDASGVALAAIQGLKLEKDEEVERLQAESEVLAGSDVSLRAQLEQQRVRIEQLEIALAKVLEHQATSQDPSS